jgi:hypothetical protein
MKCTRTQPDNAVWTCGFCPRFFIFRRTDTVAISSSFRRPMFAVSFVTSGRLAGGKGLSVVAAPFDPLALDPWPTKIWNVSLIIFNDLQSVPSWLHVPLFLWPSHVSYVFLNSRIVFISHRPDFHSKPFVPVTVIFNIWITGLIKYTSDLP